MCLLSIMTDEKLIIGKVLDMKEKGFSASRAETLPSLFKSVYGKLYNTSCGGCVKDAFDSLVKWAERKNQSLNKNHYMAKYKFKREHYGKTATVLHKGQPLRITADNLTDERANILLSIPKYAHIIEHNQIEEEAIDVNIVIKKSPAKKKAEKDVVDPNAKAEETTSAASSVSTSTAQPTVGKKSPAKKKAKQGGK